MSCKAAIPKFKTTHLLDDNQRAVIDLHSLSSLGYFLKITNKMITNAGGKSKHISSYFAQETTPTLSS